MTDHEPNPVLPDSSSDDSERSSSREENRQGQASTKPLWREYLEAIVMALVLALTIRVFLVQAFKIPSGSMIPSLQIGDHILVNKLAYGFQIPQDCEFEVALLPLTCYSSSMLLEFGKPARGDVIVFRYPEDEHKDFIKRIIGLPGDTIHVRKKIVYINGEPFQDESFTQRVDPGMIDGQINPRDNFGPVTVPPNAYFVMGDNRDQSLDSRFWGYVQEHKIKGRAFLVYWSWHGQGAWTEWVRWNRIGKAIE